MKEQIRGPAACLNIELKARCPDPARARAAAVALGAEPAGVLEQTDTYFAAPHGRLKLRETTGRPAELIGYQRADKTTARESRYRVVPVADPEPLKAALTDALGVRGVVRKRRELLLWRNVRVHLDDVAGLGTFLEFEAVVSDACGEAASRRHVASLREALGIAEDDLIGRSYSALLSL